MAPSIRLFLRATLWTVLFPGVVAGFIPWRFFRVGDAALSGVAGYAGLLVGAIGLVILLFAIVEFARRGRGTLSPADPPTRLVIAGPYRHVRNPMYAAVLFILAGEVLLSGNAGLALYALAFFVITSLFIARFEEPYLERTFGAEYVDYRANVPRWIPRIAPWKRG